MDKLEQLYPCEMADELFAKNHLKKSGEGPMGVHLHFLLGANNPFGTISSRF